MKNFFQKKEVNFIFLILIAIEIFYVSSLSFGKGSSSIALVPVTYHITIFFLLNFFILSLTNKLIFSITTSIIFAILDEVHQIFVPFRGAGIEDILIDSIGIFSATLTFFVYRKNHPKI